MTTAYPYPFVVKKAAAEIAALSAYQGDAVILRDENGRTWGWNGTGYSLGEDGGSGAQDSLDPPSPSIPPSVRAVAQAVAPVDQLVATVASLQSANDAKDQQISTMQAAILALQAAILPPGSGALTLTAPSLSGTNTVGSTLTITPGTVSGGTAVSRTFTILRNGTIIATQTSLSYTIVAADGSTSLTVTETVTNADGQATSKTSAPFAVAAAPAVPVVVTPPSITGTAASGQTLTGNHGTYTNNSGITYASYAWKNGSTVLGTSLTLAVTDAMVGLSITFTEVPHNSDGDGLPATSAPVVVAGGATPACITPPGWEESSTFAVGGVLYFNPGVWSGNPDPTLDVYGILRDSVAISVSINPASPSYTCVAADQDKTLVPTLIRKNSGSPASPMAQGAGEYIGASIGGSSPTSSFGSITSTTFSTATAGSNGFLLLPTAAGAISKSGGYPISYTALGGSLSDDASTSIATISFTGGTPTSSGSTTSGLKSRWGVIGSGIQYTIDVPAGANTAKVPCTAYGIVDLITVSFADSSASPITFTVDPGDATTSTDQLVSIPFTAGADTQLIVKIEQQTAYASGAGDSHFQGIWI